MTVVVVLERCRGGESWSWFDLAVQATVVEPVDIGEGGELDIVEAPPRSLRVDQFPFVEPVEALDEGVVVGIALGSDRRHDVVVWASPN